MRSNDNVALSGTATPSRRNQEGPAPACRFVAKTGGPAGAGPPGSPARSGWRRRPETGGRLFTRACRSVTRRPAFHARYFLYFARPNGVRGSSTGVIDHFFPALDLRRRIVRRLSQSVSAGPRESRPHPAG